MLGKRKQLISLLFNTGRAMKEHFSSQEGLTHNLLHIETIGFVLEKETPSMKDISAHLCITPASASSLIDGLVESGLLERGFGKDDRRIVRIRITQKGKELLEEGMRHGGEKMAVIFEEFKEKEVDDFIKVLERFINIINSKKTK